MIDFQPLTLAQMPLLKKYFDQSRTRICDQTLGGAMMWRNSFSTYFAEKDGVLYLKSRLASGRWAFTPPLGNLTKGVEELIRHCRETGETLSFCSVSEGEKDRILKQCPDLVATATRDWFDYLYLAENLKTLAGKKLAGQRNHKNFFLKNHADWRFLPITAENIGLAKDFFSSFSATVQKDSVYFAEEEKAVLEVLDHLEEYGFLGGMIEAEGQIVAISFCEVVGDTMFVHIEKADRQVRGAYQMMVTELISHFAKEDVVYVNREEDVGDPGLRYSKEAYHPETLLSKYTLE